MSPNSFNSALTAATSTTTIMDYASTSRINKFDGTNFRSWKCKMQMVLEERDLWEVISGEVKLERCVTAEEIAKVDAFVGANQANCTFAKYQVGGGRVEGEARCDHGGMKQHMVMHGKYTPDSSDMTIRSTTTGAPGPAGEMKMTMRIKLNRLGDC